MYSMYKCATLWLNLEFVCFFKTCYINKALIDWSVNKDWLISYRAEIFSVCSHFLCTLGDEHVQVRNYWHSVDPHTDRHARHLTNSSSPAAPLLLKTTHLAEEDTRCQWAYTHAHIQNISLVSLIYWKSMETRLTCSRGGWPDGWRGARTTACCSPWGPAGSVAWAEWRILGRGHCPGCPPSPERSGRHQGCGWAHWGPKGMLCYLGQRKYTHTKCTQRNKAMGGVLSYLR